MVFLEYRTKKSQICLLGCRCLEKVESMESDPIWVTDFRFLVI